MKIKQEKSKAMLCKTAHYKAVAFDVFDTLLRRDVGVPSDLFRLLGEAFAAARCQAEEAARAKVKGEITLAQIYAQPMLEGTAPDAECALELRAVVADPELLRLSRACHARGQRVYAVSDMYLPCEQITSMLRRCGYDFLDGIFVSCEYGVQKRSGRLFRLFLQKTGLRSAEVVFIGDSLRADVAGAALAGITALHWTRGAEGASKPGESWQGRALTAFLQNRAQRQSTPQQALGFSVLGPLVTAFADWLYLQRSAAPERPLLFLARDMALVHRVYRARYPQDENTAYLQVSRRSLCPALLAGQNFVLLKDALPRQGLSGSQIAAYCGVVCPKGWETKRFDLKHPDEGESLDEFLGALPPSEEAKELAADYLRQLRVARGAFLADIGSGGTTQRILEALTGASLRGLYLACDERLHKTLPAERTAVFLFDGRSAPRTYWAGQPMLERLISQECGTVCGYRRGEQGVAAMLDEAIKGPAVTEYQRGALDFAAAWQGSVLAEMGIAPQDAIRLFMTLIDDPTPAEAGLLGNILVEDGGTWPLAAAASLWRPKKAAASFAEARWKVGFLRRLLPLPLPYGALYRALKQ